MYCFRGLGGLELHSPPSHECDEDMAALLSDPTTMHRLAFMAKADAGGWTRQDAFERCEQRRDMQAQGKAFNFDIHLCLPKSSELIGVCGYREINHGQVGEFGMILHHKHWKKGYATQAHLLGLETGFTFLNLEKVVFKTARDNAEMQGFFQRFHIQSSRNEDSNWDQWVEYRIMKREWPRIRRALAASLSSLSVVDSNEAHQVNCTFAFCQLLQVPEASLSLISRSFDVQFTQKATEDMIAPLFSDVWTGSKLWGSSIVLCSYLMKHTACRDELGQVVELGSGACALPSWCASFLSGVKHVLATDQECIIPLTHGNIKGNADRVKLKPTLECEPLEWGNKKHIQHIVTHKLASRSVDLILAADCVNPIYGEDSYAALVATIDALVTPKRTAVLLCQRLRGPQKSNDDEKKNTQDTHTGTGSWNKFTAALTNAGYHCETVHTHEQNDTFGYVIVQAMKRENNKRFGE